MSNKDFIPAFSFNFLTPFYDFLVNLIGFGYQARVKIVKLSALKNKEKVLDVGCGTGSLLIAAKKLYPQSECFGVDIDNKILRIAQNKIQKENLKIKFFNSGADKLPFKESSFDLIVSSLAFHHMPISIKAKAIKEIKRVLKSKGRFLLVDFGKADWLGIKLLYIFETLLRMPEAITLKDNLEGKIPEILKKEGFSISEVSSRYLGIQYLMAKK